MRSHVWHLFRKDGLELLRDRRTLFVNIVLPVLLFPLVMLFMLQVTQLTRAQPVEVPRVAVLDAPQFAALLDPPADAQRPAEDAEGEHGPLRRADPRVTVVELEPAVAAELRDLATELGALEPAKGAPADPERDAALVAKRAEALRLLRANRLAAIAIGRDLADDAERRLAVVKDEAHPEWDQAEAALNRGLDDWRRRLTVDELARAGLREEVLSPVRVERLSLAPPAETLRSRFAGIIPLILVIMAASGAFYPALDLFAGERERGTLESLLSWPISRRDIFLGKLAVTFTAAVISVILNLSSMGITTAMAGSAFAGPGAGISAGGLLSVGTGTLLLCFVALLPLVVTLATVSLALAGYAASAKEAQNYLTPLILVVFFAAIVGIIPGTKPSLPLDLVPITGPVLALKESLRSAEIPWLHLALSTATSLALAVVIVGWAVRLLESERFCYPGLVRAGWGRFRQWGPPAEAPGAIEVVAVFALCVAGFTVGGAMLERAGLPPFLKLVAPLVLFVAAPALIHRWLGDYPWRTGLHLARPRREHLQRALVCIPLAVASSIGLSAALDPFVPDFIREAFAKSIDGFDNPWVRIVAIGLAPGICEELLCRGTFLAGLRRPIGAWGAAVVSAFLFAVLHLTPYRFVPQFAIGVILGLLTIRSGSLFPAMLLHAGHNIVIAFLPATLALPSWWVGLVMAGSGWLAMLAVVALPEPLRRTPPAIAPPPASTTPETP